MNTRRMITNRIMLDKYNNEEKIKMLSSYFEKSFKDYCLFIDPNEYDNKYYNYVGNMLCSDERRLVLSVYNKCKCCIRHQENRPNMSQYLLGFSGNYDDYISDDNITDASSDTDKEINNVFCECMCRHMCRELCRVQNIMNEVTYSK